MHVFNLSHFTTKIIHFTAAKSSERTATVCCTPEVILVPSSLKSFTVKGKETPSKKHHFT